MHERGFHPTSVCQPTFAAIPKTVDEQNVLFSCAIVRKRLRRLSNVYNNREERTNVNFLVSFPSIHDHQDMREYCHYVLDKSDPASVMYAQTRWGNENKATTKDSECILQSFRQKLVIR